MPDVVVYDSEHDPGDDDLGHEGQPEAEEP